MNIMINYSASSCKPVFGGGVSGLSASTSELSYSSPAALAELKAEEVRTLCGHISPGIYVRKMSALYPSLVFSSG